MNTNLNSARGKSRPLRVLLVEDCEPDAMLMERALERGGFTAVCERVDTAEEMQVALGRRKWDLILADHSMPTFDAPTALKMVKDHGLDIPFIIVSGHIDEETAIQAMRSGAHDYVMKDRLARLAPVVERELREAEVRRARKEYERELRQARKELEMRVEQRTAALRAANLQLENVIEERKRLELELLEIAENERRSIGFDLHDDLGQKLTGLSLMVKGLEHRLTAEKHPCTPDAANVHELITELIHHTHDLAHQFSSLDVKGDDLASVLKDLAENVQNMFGIPCALTVPEPAPELPRHTIQQLYKITQEAISNAVKHGKAAEVCVNLLRNCDRLTLSIANNGRPFAPSAAAKKRMGLRIMNYRASTLGASLEIKPGENGGTVVICSIPFRNGASLRRRGHNRAQRPKPGEHPAPQIKALAAA